MAKIRRALDLIQAAAAVGVVVAFATDSKPAAVIGLVVTCITSVANLCLSGYEA